MDSQQETQEKTHWSNRLGVPGFLVFIGGLVLAAIGAARNSTLILILGAVVLTLGVAMILPTLAFSIKHWGDRAKASQVDRKATQQRHNGSKK